MYDIVTIVNNIVYRKYSKRVDLKHSQRACTNKNPRTHINKNKPGIPAHLGLGLFDTFYFQ